MIYYSITQRVYKIPDDKKKYIDIIFDYDKYDINDSFVIKGININIVDNVVGISDESNYKSLLYFASCDDHVGNMSCFPPSPNNVVYKILCMFLLYKYLI